jgi:hypothetical protein
VDWFVYRPDRPGSMLLVDDDSDDDSGVIRKPYLAHICASLTLLQKDRFIVDSGADNSCLFGICLAKGFSFDTNDDHVCTVPGLQTLRF